MDDTNNPAWLPPAYKQMTRAWRMMLDLYGGTMALRDAIMSAHRIGQVRTPVPLSSYAPLGKWDGPYTYLPRHPKEEEDDYLIRLFNTELYNAVKHTIRGLSGMVMRRDPKLGDDVSARFKAHWEDIDYAGTHGDLFTRAVVENALLFGHHGILVEAPSENATAPAITIAQEEEVGGRPYWVHCRADQILNIRSTTLPSGEHVYTQVVLQLQVKRPKGPFMEENATQWLVLALNTETLVVTYERWEKKSLGTGKKDTWTIVGKGVMKNQQRIPFVLCAASELTNNIETVPPLLDLGYLNLAHFRVQSDHRHALHMASVPFLVFKGRTKASASVSVGPNTAIDIPKDADAMYVEHSGSALGGTAAELKTLEGRMAHMGLAMLQRESAAAETAEAKRLDKNDQDSALAMLSRSAEDALERAMGFHAAYLGEKDGGSISLNRDFEGAAMSVEEMNAYSAQVTAGQLTLETMWDIMIEGGRLPADFDPEEEQKALDEASLPPLDLFSSAPAQPVVDAAGNPLPPQAGDGAGTKAVTLPVPSATP